METKQIRVKIMFFLSVIIALLCCHQSEAQAPIPSPNGCYSSIMEVQGCLDAVKAASKGDFKGLGKDCCHALNGLSDECFLDLFPGMFYIVVVVKAICNIY
ncbi:PREDICTED: uncharacterized protein LOC104769740 [Camelina sativa]|uniref:Uncharacterized protein LOC104769740 n=1 Tax=Camelina sativa TaxID=90675 RepID=A0ABM0XXA2_CAMSA|nr:PREDICTED: uncharacterized protein LOC104769740 [Camelina sativa]